MLPQVLLAFGFVPFVHGRILTQSATLRRLLTKATAVGAHLIFDCQLQTLVIAKARGVNADPAFGDSAMSSFFPQKAAEGVQMKVPAHKKYFTSQVFLNLLETKSLPYGVLVGDHMGHNLATTWLRVQLGCQDRFDLLFSLAPLRALHGQIRFHENMFDHSSCVALVDFTQIF
jgi:hypothetical protein